MKNYKAISKNSLEWVYFSAFNLNAYRFMFYMIKEV